MKLFQFAVKCPLRQILARNATRNLAAVLARGIRGEDRKDPVPIPCFCDHVHADEHQRQGRAAVTEEGIANVT